ncbi:MAG: ATP-grasp domain-containing protein, partial [Ruminococcus sp.]|nr:ATP-grasp domain-containing protein [Ruminococcus sp.]
DADAIVDYVKKEKINGVLVGVAEALMTSYCKVCEKLEYPCFASLEQFEIMTAKNKFKDICRKYDVPVVDEYSLDNLDEVRYPAVVKPVDSSSSKGISICQNRAELDKAMEKALSFSPSKTILIEKYMGGLEVIMYYIIQNGEPAFVAMCDRYTSKEQEGITQLPSAYIFPSKHIERFRAEADEKVCNMLRGLDITNGVLFLQSFIDDDGSVRIYEPGFRLNGAQEHMIVSQITGIDAKELLINYALTGKMSDKKISGMADPYFKGMWACKLSPLVKEGKIGKIEGIDAIRGMEGVISVNPNYENDEIVKGLGTQRQMAANIFIYANDRDELAERVDRVIENFRVFDENGGNMLLKPFDTNIIMQEY